VVWVNQFAVLPSDGGGTRHFELGRELVRRGWRVTVVASDLHLHRRVFTRRPTPHSRGAVSERVDDVDFQWLWSASYQKNNWRRLYNWVSFGNEVKKAVRTIDKPGVIIGSSPQLLAARSAFHIARDLRVPFVFEVRDLWPESLTAAGGGSGIGYKTLRYIAEKLYREADKILVLAEGARDYLIERGIPAAKLVHVPNGVDVNAICPRTEEDTRKNDGTFRVLYAGAHGPANGLEAVLDAAERVQASPHIQFLLIGDGPLKAELVKEAERRGLTNVKFHAPVAKSELARILAESDAGLMVLREAPLFSFGVSPNKLFDYLAAALPVVCNVPGEVASMLANSGAGVQVQDASGAALADGIMELSRMSADERRRKGITARRWVEREHSRGVLGDRLDAILRDVVQR